MNQTNKLVNKIKDLEIESSNKDKSDDSSQTTISNLTEDNLDEYLANVETDEHSKELLQKYLDKKTNNKKH